MTYPQLGALNLEEATGRLQVPTNPAKLQANTRRLCTRPLFWGPSGHLTGSAPKRGLIRGAASEWPALLRRCIFLRGSYTCTGHWAAQTPAVAQIQTGMFSVAPASTHETSTKLPAPSSAQVLESTPNYGFPLCVLSPREQDESRFHGCKGDSGHRIPRSFPDSHLTDKDVTILFNQSPFLLPRTQIHCQNGSHTV